MLRASRLTLVLAGFLFIFGVFGVVGCQFDDSALDRQPCSTDADCPDGNICAAGVCVSRDGITLPDTMQNEVSDADTTPPDLGFPCGATAEREVSDDLEGVVRRGRDQLLFGGPSEHPPDAGDVVVHGLARETLADELAADRLELAGAD